MSAVIEHNGQWWVATGFGAEIVGPFPTNAQAWRWADRHDGHPVSKSEDTSEWINEKALG